MEDHKIAACSMDGIWLKGTVDDFIFQVKVCDEASRFGIDGGRIIKLHVEQSRGENPSKVIIAYERGWDKRPRGKHKDVARAMILFCDSLPEHAVWSKTFYRKVRRFLITDGFVLEYDEHGNPC